MNTSKKSDLVSDVTEEAMCSVALTWVGQMLAIERA